MLKFVAAMLLIMGNSPAPAPQAQSVQGEAEIAAKDAETQAASAPGQKNPLDVVVCRKYVNTGSRVSSRKECKTRRQWGALADRSREEFERNNDRASAFRTSGE